MLTITNTAKKTNSTGKTLSINSKEFKYERVSGLTETDSYINKLAEHILSILELILLF